LSLIYPQDAGTRVLQNTDNDIMDLTTASLKRTAFIKFLHAQFFLTQNLITQNSENKT
jgi:hypothetical protein